MATFAVYDSLGNPLGVQKSIYEIYNALNALTNSQKTAIWNDISSGSPAKYLLSEGIGASGIAVLDWAVRDSGATGASLTNARLRIVALYLLDNPLYLKNPSFDLTINLLSHTAVSIEALPL